MPALDWASQLLNDRELSYQGALQVGRNDLLFQEKVLNSLVDDYSINPELVKDLQTMISKTRRARRDITSEGSYLFEDDVLNNAFGIAGQTDLHRTVDVTESNERRRSQPVPGTEAHHPASVSSTEALVQNMNEREVRKLWNIAKKNGYTVGSQADGFIPLSKPAHTTGGKTWGSDYAHVGADGKTPDPGRFKTTPLPKGTTAQEAWKALKPVLDEQRQLNERAYNHPYEQRTRQLAEQTVGQPIEWRGPVTSNREALRTDARSKGVNATTISKSIDQNPGLLKSDKTPGVDIMTPVGARVPLGTKPEQRPPQPRPTTTTRSANPSRRGQGSRSKPVFRNRLMTPRRGSGGAGGMQLLQMSAPSQERFGPMGTFGTIDQPHERQFIWRR